MCSVDTNSTKHNENRWCRVQVSSGRRHSLRSPGNCVPDVTRLFLHTGLSQCTQARYGKNQKCRLSGQSQARHESCQNYRHPNSGGVNFVHSVVGLPALRRDFPRTSQQLVFSLVDDVGSAQLCLRPCSLLL